MGVFQKTLKNIKNNNIFLIIPIIIKMARKHMRICEEKNIRLIEDENFDLSVQILVVHV